MRKKIESLSVLFVGDNGFISQVSAIEMGNKINELIQAHNKQIEEDRLRYVFGEDNPEEWENYIDNLFGTGHNGIWQVRVGEIMQLKKFIQSLLDERSFSREELEIIRDVIGGYDEWNMSSYKEDIENLSSKVDRLLSLDQG